MTDHSTAAAPQILADISSLPEKVIALLRQCGSMQRSHSGRTLFDHLVGTYNLLRAWGNRDAVCLGGLFHSIYGTNVFHHQSLSERDRPELQGLIGRDAEQLAWHFCHVDRPQAIIAAIKEKRAHLSAMISLPTEMEWEPDWYALAEIEVANLIEQSSGGQALRSLFFMGMEQPGVLSAAAQNSVRHALSAQLRVRPLPADVVGSVSLPQGGVQ
jgi:hypothetical protein